MQGSRNIGLPGGKQATGAGGAIMIMGVGTILGPDATLEYATGTRRLRFSLGMGPGTDDGPGARGEAAGLRPLYLLVRVGQRATSGAGLARCHS